MSACSFSVDSTQDISYFRFDGSNGTLPIAAELYDNLRNGKESHLPIWIPMPQDPTSLLGLFMYESGARSRRTSLEAAYIYVVYTVSSFWWSTVTSLTKTDFGFLIESDWPGIKEATVHHSLRPITIDPEGISSLRSYELWEAMHTDTRILVSTFIATLSRVPGGITGNSSHDEVDDNIIYGYDRSKVHDISSSTAFTIDAMTSGFGFGSTDTATRLSLAVVTTYCVITTLYIVYINITGHTSIAWNSATELIMLALQPKKPDNIGHVSVGLDSMETVRRSVGIRVNTSNIADTGEGIERLVLVFEHDEGMEKRDLKKVERNKAY
jgi:hypothetical protein